MKFDLQGEEFIELIKLIKLLGIAESGGSAKQMVERGEIVVNNQIEYRKRKKLRQDDVIKIGNDIIEIK